MASQIEGMAPANKHGVKFQRGKQDQPYRATYLRILSADVHGTLSL